MATASKTTETVKVPVTTYKDVTTVTGVTLNLSLAEAQALKAALGYIECPGDPDLTIRKLVDPVFWALSKAGVQAPDVPVFKIMPVTQPTDLTKFGV